MMPEADAVAPLSAGLVRPDDAISPSDICYTSDSHSLAAGLKCFLKRLTMWQQQQPAACPSGQADAMVHSYDDFNTACPGRSI